MSSKGLQPVPGGKVRSKRRIITSCSECHRRKQKCDRSRPCNFCTSRNVPDRCRYGKPSQLPDEYPPSSGQGQPHSPPESEGDDFASMTNDPPLSFNDRVGYDTTFRQTQLRLLEPDILSAIVNHENSDLRYAKHDAKAYLNLVDRIPTKDTTDKLVKLYFSSQAWSFPLLDEGCFTALHDEFRNHLADQSPSHDILQMSPRLSLFPSLLFSVLASAVQVVDPETDLARSLDIGTASRCDQISHTLLDIGQKISDLLGQREPNTTSVEFHLMKTAWLKNSGRGSEAWQCLGVALRQAQEIGLHQIQDNIIQNTTADVGRTLTRLWDIEHKKRIWARIFVMESHMAVALGRPRGIHREDCCTSTPLDCDYPSKPSETVPLNVNHDTGPPTSFSPVLFSVMLAHKYHDLMSLRASKQDLSNHTKVDALHDEVQSLLAELPSSLRPSLPDTTWDGENPLLPAIRLRLLTTTNVFLLALHRPYASTHITSRRAATGAALTILQAQNQLFGLIPQAEHRLYGYSFYITDVGVYLAAQLTKYPHFDPGQRFTALQALQQASLHIGLMKDRSRIAQQGELILQRCCAAVEKVGTTTIDEPSSEDLFSIDRSTQFGDVNLFQEFGRHLPTNANLELFGFASQTNRSIDTISPEYIFDEADFDNISSAINDPLPAVPTNYLELDDLP